MRATNQASGILDENIDKNKMEKKNKIFNPIYAYFVLFTILICRIMV
jgi:hypothetical protein